MYVNVWSTISTYDSIQIDRLPSAIPSALSSEEARADAELNANARWKDLCAPVLRLGSAALRMSAFKSVRVAAQRLLEAADYTYLSVLKCFGSEATQPVITHGILVWRWFVCGCMEDDQRL